MKRQYEAVVVGSCNLEICVEDRELAERLLNQFPGGNRKLYPIVRKEKGGYRVEPTEKFPISLWVPEEKVKHILASGGGANAAKVLAKLGANVLFITSVGGGENYETMVNSLREEPRVEFEDILARPKVGLTLNIVAEDIPSTLLIYGGGGKWNIEKVKDAAKEIIKNFALNLPILAIANSPPYLPILEELIKEKGRVEYFCPSRAHINALSKSDHKYFAGATFIQDNIDNIADIYRALWNKPWTKENDEELLLRIEELSWRWKNSIIATRSEKGGLFLVKEKKTKTGTYQAYPLPGPFRDDTGAGDVFAGAFFWSYFLKKSTVEEAIEFAASYATFPITSIGAIGILPTEEQVKDWIKQRGPKIIYRK